MAFSFDLPAPVICNTFKNLSFNDLASSSLVCKIWNRIANSDPLWEFLSRRNLGVTECDPAFSWKEWYRLLTKKIHNFTQFHLLGRKIILVWEKSFCFDETTNFQQRGFQRGRIMISDHTQNITCSDVQERGKFIHFYTGSFDRHLKIWRLNIASGTFKHMQTIDQHTGMITAIVSNPQFVFCGSTDKTISIWQYTHQYNHSQTLTGHEKAIQSLVVNQPGTLLFSASKDTTIRIWKNEDDLFAHFQTLIGHHMEVTNIKLAEPKLISGDCMGSVRLWQEQYNKLWSCVKVIQAHPYPISTICCYQESSSFCTGGGFEVKLWKIAKKNRCQPAKITQITNVLVAKMLFNHHIGYCEFDELYILTENEIQISWVSEEGISTTNKTIEFPHEICHNIDD
jgi:WD40 repeat protein